MLVQSMLLVLSYVKTDLVSSQFHVFDISFLVPVASIVISFLQVGKLF